MPPPLLATSSTCSQATAASLPCTIHCSWPRTPCSLSPTLHKLIPLISKGYFHQHFTWRPPGPTCSQMSSCLLFLPDWHSRNMADHPWIQTWQFWVKQANISSILTDADFNCGRFNSGILCTLFTIPAWLAFWKYGLTILYADLAVLCGISKHQYYP